MTGRPIRPSLLSFLAASALLSAAVVYGQAAAEGRPEPPSDVPAYVHPTPLTAADDLRDGETGRRIEISTETMLVWVDRMPEARFEHPTEYVLISAEGTRVLKGGWWPVLNGEPLFRTGKPEQVEFPIGLKRTTRASGP